MSKDIVERLRKRLQI